MRYADQSDWLADVRHALSSAALVEPPTWVRERAHRLYVAPTRSAPTFLERIKASLIFDSRRSTAMATAGVRSLGMFDASLDGPWQLLYRGGDVDVDLLVRPNLDGHTMNVRGQALSLAGDGVGAGVVEALPAADSRTLRTPPVPSARTEVEPSGEFALANLERGRYDVLLRFGAREIELMGVEL